MPWFVTVVAHRHVGRLLEENGSWQSRPADVTVTRFSTSALPVSGRGKAIEELYERGLLPTRFTSCDGAVPHIAFTRRVMSGLDILTGSYAFLRHEGVARDSDLYLWITVVGTRTARRRERELVLRDGDAVLTTGDGFAGP